MSHQISGISGISSISSISGIRIELVQHFKAAFDDAGAAGIGEARYQRGRKDGLGQALQLVDVFLRSEEEAAAVEPRRIEEIIAVVESIAEGGVGRP